MSFFRKYKTYIVYAAITLGLGVLSALITGSYSIYDNFVKPALAPPAIVFPIVWTILYILIVAAAVYYFTIHYFEKQQTYIVACLVHRRYL